MKNRTIIPFVQKDQLFSVNSCFKSIKGSKELDYYDLINKFEY